MSDTEHIKRIAGAGLNGPAQQMPHQEAIQSSFGASHDVSSMRAFVGGHASDANDLLGAKAYAAGNNVAFAEKPDLRVAAHEAAHVVQQRAGVSLSDGVGKSGDSCEHRADAVADRVVQGRSAADLLNPYQDASGGKGSVQLYTKARWKKSKAKIRVSTNKAILVTQESDEGGQDIWATQDRVDEAEHKLEQAGSGISIEVTGTTKTIFGKTMQEVAPSIRNTAITDVDDNDRKKIKEMNQPKDKDRKEDDDGDDRNWLALWTDCGRASREVMGTGGQAPKGVYKMGDKQKETQKSYNPKNWTDELYLNGFKAFMADEGNQAHLKKAGLLKKKKVLFFWTKWEKTEPVDGKEAKKFFFELDKAGQLAFGKQIGMNEGANPEIGQAYTMATGYDLPGFEKKGRTWNFHWAGVIMKDGGDNVTCEGYSVGASKEEINEVKAKYAKEPKKMKSELKKLRKKYARWVNKDWVSQMYGTDDPKQTFHNEHLTSLTHGTRATSMVATK